MIWMARAHHWRTHHLLRWACLGSAETSMVVDGLCAQLQGVPFLGQFTFGEQGTFPGGEAAMATS